MRTRTRRPRRREERDGTDGSEIAGMGTRAFEGRKRTRHSIPNWRATGFRVTWHEVKPTPIKGGRSWDANPTLETSFSHKRLRLDAPTVQIAGAIMYPRPCSVKGFLN